MDTHTIFPPLANGEQVIGKHKTSPLCECLTYVAILTNHRLLTRSLQTFCCCCHRSSYSAISLESIHRIDEHHDRPRIFLYSVLWIFSLLASIAGVLVSIFIVKDETIKIIVYSASGAVLAVMSIIVFACSCCCFKRKLIQLQGTFGSKHLSFGKKKARLFEAQLSEQVSQAKGRTQQIPISAISLPTPYSLRATRKPKQTMETSDRF